MLSELSMILILIDNQPRLKHIIEYYAPTNLQLFILDASEHAYTDSILQRASNTHYYHLPKTSMTERFKFALTKVNTEYAVFRADRRHHTHKGLQDAINFLRENADYSSVGGIWLHGKKLQPRYCGDIVSHAGEFEDPLERTRNRALCATATFYDVQRTAFMKFIVDVLYTTKAENINPYYMELIVTFLMSFLGKEKIISNCCGIMQDKAVPSSYCSQAGEMRELIEDKKTMLCLFSAIQECAIKHNIVVDGSLLLNSLEAYYKGSGLFWDFCYVDSKLGMDEHITKIYASLKENKNDDYLKDVLRVLCRLKLEKITYKNVEHLFSEEDIKEKEKLLNVIAQIEKPSFLSRLRRSISKRRRALRQLF